MTRFAWFVIGFFAAAMALAGAPVMASSAGALPAPALTIIQLTAIPDDGVRNEPGPQSSASADNAITAVGGFGLAGEVQCWNCTPFAQTIRLSHYDPMSGKENCWDYDESRAYCYSPTKPGIRWKGAWGFGAACPIDWPYGTWVVVPGVGAFVCLDRGGLITCDPDTQICAVDILGPSGPWDGQTVEATLWVPLDPPRGEQ